MVVKIQPPSRDLENALRYNERKMTAAERVMTREEADEYLENDNFGHVLATRNVPQDSTLLGEFERLHGLNVRTRIGRALRNETFHMSINPGPGDRPMDEDEILAFTDRLMDSLGYARNPYRVYRHDDTGRTHYHVVATRIGQDGRKVGSDFERMRCMNAAKELCREFGIVYGLGDGKDRKEKKDERNGKKENRGKKGNCGYNESRPKSPEGPPAGETASADTGQKRFIRPFMRTSSTPVGDQLRTFHAAAMQWRFTTLAQYGAIMRRRFMADTGVYDDGLHFWGLDSRGRRATCRMTEGDLGLDALDGVLERCRATDMSLCRDQRGRLERAADACSDGAGSWEEFRAMMLAKGIYCVISWSREGEPFGVTWLDRATRCAWKGSETLWDMARLRRTAEEKGWTITRDPLHEREPSRRGARAEAASVGRAARSSDRNGIWTYDDRRSMEEIGDRRGIGRHRRDNSSATYNRGELEDDVRRTGVKI